MRDDAARFAIRARVFLPALGAEIVLARDVVVTIRESRATTEAGDALWRLDFAPADDGPFPRVLGSLTIADGGRSSPLSVDGTYERVREDLAERDGGIGHRIVQATARDLLALVRDGVESSYRIARDDLR